MGLRLLVLSSPDPTITSLDLSEGLSVAGREAGRELYLPSSKVSRKHCSFELRGGEVVVRDLGSANGVVVEGQKIREAVLAIGQRIQLGDYLLQLSDASDSQSAPVEDLFGGTEAASGNDETSQPLFGSVDNSGSSALFGEEGDSVDAPSFEEMFGTPSSDSVPPRSAESSDAPPAFGNQSTHHQPPPLSRAPVSSRSMGEPHRRTNPRASSSSLDGLLDSVGANKVRKLVSKVPWAGKLGGLFFLALLSTLFLPLGGVKNLLSGVDAGMENLARTYAVELATTIARVNGGTLSMLDATSISSGSIGGADRAKGVIAGEAFLLDSRGRIKPSSDRPNPRPRLVQTASETQSVASETDPETGLFYVVAPIRISIGNAPSQIRGFVYIGFSEEDFLEDTGRANDLFPSAMLLVFLVFALLFWLVRGHVRRPILAAAEESELAIKGHVDKVSLRESWPELGALLHSVNRAISRSGAASDLGVKEKNELSESLVKSSAWPVIVTDGDLNVTLINDIALRIFGLKSGNGVGAHISRVITKEPLSRAVLGALKTIESGASDRVTQTVNVDGSQRRVTVSSKLALETNKSNPGSDRKVFEFVVVVIA